jgi:hypothetical protein
MKTTAQLIADDFGNDGTNFEYVGSSLDYREQRLEDLCEFGACHIRRDGGRTQYVFADESSIVVAGAAWDIGLSPRCYCWEGAGHCDGCPVGGAQ